MFVVIIIVSFIITISDRFATQPYSARALDTNNRFIHLTNYSVNKVITILRNVTTTITRDVKTSSTTSPLVRRLVISGG